MLYTDRQPSLMAYREVSGMTDEHARLLRGRLVKAGLSRGLVKSSLAHFGKLRSPLLMRDELREFYTYNRLDVDEATVARLGEFLEGNVQGFVDPGERVPLLPARLHPPNDTESSRRFLKVAHSEATIAQRAIIKTGVVAFFEEEYGQAMKAPEDLWFEDSFVLGPMITGSYKPAQLGLIAALDKLLHEEGPELTETGILPADIGIGRLAIKYYT